MTQEFIIEIGGKKYQIPLSGDFKLRTQNPACTNHICAEYRGQAVCLTPHVGKDPDDAKNLIFGDIRCCSKNQNYPKIAIEG